MKNGLLIIIIILGLSSCRTIDFSGRYELSSSHKSSIELKKDGTFQLTELDPYLFDFNNGNCFTSSGTWNVLNNKLILNSFKDSSGIKTPEIIEMREDLSMVDTGTWIGKRYPLSYSTFTFYDIQNDTLDILSGSAPDGSEIFKLHRTMKFLLWPTMPDIADYNYNLSDTMEFRFLGYESFKFVRTDRVRRVIKVRLYPKKIGNEFWVGHFLIDRRRIKDGKIKFDKVY